MGYIKRNEIIMERIALKKKVLVTGGAGFIGSHVTELLCNQGYFVIVIDDLSFGYRKFIDNRASFIKGSIGDMVLMSKVLKGVDTVVHLAASSIIKYSYEHPFDYYQNNLVHGITLLEAMRKNKVRKIINSSTAAVYGFSKKQPITESFPKDPVSIYGSSKLAFEQALKTYHHAFGIENVSLRYFNVYGPRDQQRPVTRAIPTWIHAILHNIPLPVYWEGNQLRDYIYVEDVAKAHAAVINTSGSRIYNIGSGSGILMKGILKILAHIVKRKLTIEDMKKRRGDPMKLVADTTAIRNEIGWKPEVSLEEGLLKTFRYYEAVYSTNL